MKKLPSRGELEKLLAQLSHKVDALLKKCAHATLLRGPDYLTFRNEAFALLKPFFEYYDAMFHEGRPSEGLILWNAVRVFAKKKHECHQLLEKVGQQSQGDISEALNAFAELKLLIHFFEETHPSYQYSPLEFFDLLYQLEVETDPQKYQRLLDKAYHIYEDSSTALYFKALAAMNSGDIDSALELCERAIKKFPDNTPAYALKSKILEAKAQKVLEEGLLREPRDKALKIAHDIGKHLHTLRERYAEGLLDSETAIEDLERVIQERIQREGIDLILYEENVKKSLLDPSVVEQKTMTFLCTGEFLLTNLPLSLDYAPSAVEFCKAIETELRERLFKPFRDLCRKNLPESVAITEEARPLSDVIYKNKKFTLGNMAMVLQFLGSKKLLQENKLFQELRKFIDSFPHPEFLLSNNGVRPILTPQAVEENRNSGVHSSIFSIEKAQQTKLWCYSIINLFIRSQQIKQN